MHKSKLEVLFFLFSIVIQTYGVELTFELPENAKQCFYEDIQQGVKSTIEFQVVTGGHYDVDAMLVSPSEQVLYHAIKKQMDTYSFNAEQTGVYRLCFSNEFSTFTNKLVYMDFFVGGEKPLPGVGGRSTAMTKLEASLYNSHEKLNTIIDYQTHHRLMEAQGRKRAEDLNTGVLYWSLGESILILLIGFGQVMILKNFFNERKSYT